MQNKTKFWIVGGITLFIVVLVAAFTHGFDEPNLEPDMDSDQALTYATAPDEWFSCDEDADCLYLDYSLCGNDHEWIVVNGQYVQEVDSLLGPERDRILSDDYLCTEEGSIPPEEYPVCVNSICTIPDEACERLDLPGCTPRKSH